MALKKSFHCIVCDTDFAPYKWTAADGHRHVVERKTYYSPASNWGTYVSEERFVKVEGSENAVRIPARLVRFAMGTYSTTDPEDQLTLDAQCPMTYEEWERIYIPEKERIAKKERELKAREAALLQRENELLARVKAETK